MLLVQGMILSAFSLAVIGQSTQDVEEDYDQVVEVIDLARANPRWFCHALGQMKLGVRCQEISNQRLVLGGSRKDVTRVMEDLLPKLDVARATSLQARSIRLSKYPPRKIEVLLRNLATSELARIAVDESNRTLIVQGNDEDFALVQQLVEWVDRPTEALTLHFYFIRAAVGGGAGGATGSLPENLQPILGTMAANGFGAMNLLATIMIRADEGSHFQQSSTLRSEGGDEAEELGFSVGGEARLDANGSAVQLEVEAAVFGEGFTAENQRNTQFEVETSVALNLNGYAILAAGPGSTADGNALAIVVRVTKN